MSFKIKKIVIYISLAMFLTALSGCKDSDNVVKKIIPVNTKVTYPIKLTAVIPEYKANYADGFKDFKAYVKSTLPDYDVTLTTVKGDAAAYDSKIRILESSSDIPDILYSEDDTHVDELLAKGKVAAIDKYLDKLDFWDTVMPSAKVKGYKGHIYAVPLDDVSYEIIQYNNEIFNANKLPVPTTFDDLKHVVEVLKAKNITPIAVGAKDGYPVAMMMEGFAYTVDPQITTNIVNGKAKFSDGPYKMAAGKVKDLMKLNAFEKDAQNVTDSEAAQLYYDGKAAMYFCSSEKFDTANTKLKGNSRIMYYPVLNASDKDNYGKASAGGVKPDSGLFVSTASKYPLDAAKLAVEMSKYYCKYLYEQKNNPAIIYNESNLKVNANSKIPMPIMSFMDNVKSFKTSKGFIQDIMPSDAAVKIMNDSCTAFMTGFINVDNYLKEMDTAVSTKQ